MVMNAIKNPSTKHRYLYLNSIREIIINDSHALESEYNTLCDELLKLSNHQEDRIRTLVAECLGTLFSAYPIDMQTDIQAALMDKDLKKVATVARSFMYSGKKIEGDMVDDAFEDCAADLVKLVASKDRDIKWFSLEGVLAICRTNPRLLAKNMNALLKGAFGELAINPAYIQEIQLPDNTVQKIDNGVPIRRSAYSLINHLVDVGACDKQVVLDLIDFIAANGVKETIDDMFLHIFQVVSQLWKKNSAVAHSKVEPMIAAVDPKFDFWVKNLANESIEKKTVAVFRVVYQMTECAEN